MKKALSIFLVITLLVVSIPTAMISVLAGTGSNATNFLADFTAASTQWEGTRTDFLGYTGSGTATTGSYFGTGKGWENASGNIITKDAFDFGEKFEAKFSLYTNWGNGEKNNFFEDFHINIGKFTIAIADHQTRIELYYDGAPVDGDFSCTNSTYTQIRDYSYTAHFEKGKIKITSNIATYTSDFADFDPVNDAKVEIKFRETWQIYKDYFSSLSVGAVVENATSFTADFTKASTQWSGVRTDLLGYTGSGTTYNDEGTYFGNGEGFVNSQKTGAISTVDNFDFGEEFTLNFKLYTAWANNYVNNASRDVHIEVGKFKIAICDYQTRIVVAYNGNDITGESVCANKAYVSPKDTEYSVTIKKGEIKVTSSNLTYTSSFADFEAQDNVKVSVSINETWQIHKVYFSELSVKGVDKAVENEKAFIADFTKASTQWADDGLNKYLGYTGTGNNFSNEGSYFGNGAGWGNSKGAITTVNNYDFGEEMKMEFSMVTDYSNGNTNNASLDAYVEIGAFRIYLCDNQTRIIVKYNGNTITGESVCSNKAYVTPKTQNYTVSIKKGDIKIQSETITYTSAFDGFENLDNVKVSVGINEDWQIWTLYFKNLKAEAVVKPIENEKTFIADFTKASTQWADDGLNKYLGYTGTENNFSNEGSYFGNGAGWSNSTGAITTLNSFDFGSLAEMDFTFYTEYSNGNTNNASLDAYIEIGAFRIYLCDNQTRIIVKYNGNTITGESVCSNKAYVTPKTQNYTVSIKKGDIKIQSETVTYTSAFDGFENLDNVKVSVGISETWQIYSLCFKNLKIEGKEDTTPATPKTELVADFSSSSDVEGLTDYIGYGKYSDTYGTDDSAAIKNGILTFKDTFNFGSKTDLRFNLYTKIEGAPSGEDFFVTVGKFKLAICDGQKNIKLYYDGNPVSGSTDIKGDAAAIASDFKDYDYIVHFEKGNIIVENELLKFTSTFDGFETVDEAKVSISVNDTSTVYKKFYFADFAVNVPKKVYENGGNSFYSDFGDKTLFEGTLLGSVDTANKIFPLNKGWKNPTGQINSSKVYSFGNKYSAWFSLKTVSLNDTYKLDQNGNYQMNDYEVSVGDLTLQSRHFQNGIAVEYRGEEVASVYATERSFGEKNYTYELSVNGTSVKLVQKKGETVLLTLECTVPELTSSSDDLVKLAVLEDWAIYEGYFSNILIADDTLGITSVEDYLNKLAESKYDWSENAYGGDTFESDFGDISLWMDDLTEYIKPEKNEFRPKWGWDNKTGKISSAKWYNFSEAVEARFDLYTEYYNDSLHNNPESYKLADYRFNIGRFTVEIRHFQHAIALFYDGELIKTVQREENSYWQKTYSYVVSIKKGDITIRQTSSGKTVLELKSDFADFEPVNNARVSIEVVEDAQVYVSYVKSITVKPIKIYKTVRSFNALSDIKKVLAADDAVTAFKKTQWSIVQRFKSAYSAGEWGFDDLSYKLNVSGFYDSVPITPAPIPVMHINNGAYSTELGVYDGKLLLRGNYADLHERKSALAFTAPATGKIRIHDPELGLIAVAAQLNGMNTWCMNSSDSEVKSIYISIYINDKKIWPLDSDEFLFSNGSHPDSSVPVTNTAFPDLIADVKQGDVVYFVFRPDHYQKANNYLLFNNPTVVTMNPQIDYISVSGDFLLNEDKEIVEEIVDVNIADQIGNKNFGIRDEQKKDTAAQGRGLPVLAIIGIIVGGVILLGAIALTIIVLIKKKRRASNV